MNKRYHSNRKWGLNLLCLAFFFGVVSHASAQSAESIKSAFIFNFAKFVDWPATAFADANAPVVVGFISGNPVADTLEQAIKGKNVNGREVQVKRLTGTTGADACQILFVGDAAQTSAVLAALKGKPVLTVGEDAAFLEGGGMIAFSMDGSKVVFDVNAGTLKGAGLTANPKLLKVARTVKGE